MPLVIGCPSCSASMRVRDEYAGKQVKCPKCAAIVAVPAAPAAVAEVLPVLRPAPAVPQSNGDEVLTVVPIEPVSREQRCSACGKRNPRGAERCQACGAWLEEERAEDRRRPSRKAVGYVPCPKCGARDAQRVTWTPWGSFYGPAMFTHVRCLECRYAYNGRTGGSNLIPAILFVTFPLLGLLAIFGGLFWMIVRMR